MALQLLEPLLWLQLALLVARQANDFLGLQWLAVLVNFVAILVSIGALFGHRALHFFFQFPLFVYNLFSCLAHNQWPSGQWTRALHLDTGARPFAFHVLRDHVLWSEARAERVAALAESVQSSVHLILSSALILAHLLYYRRRRLKLRKNNSKTTPPLPPYTISLHVDPRFGRASLPRTRHSQRRRSTRSTASQKRRRKQLLASNYPSDSETDFYGHFTRGGLSNPLYLATGHLDQSETRI